MGKLEISGASKGQREKDIRLSLKAVEEKRKKQIKEEEEATGEEKLEYEIGRLKNIISSCNLDLQNPTLKGNVNILTKKSNAEKQLEELLKR